MDRRDLDAWEPQEPPRGFAERVVAEAIHGLAPRRLRARSIASGATLAAAMAAAVSVAAHLRGVDAHGDIVADARREVRVGTRAVAVLEKGAHVTWSGDAVAQTDGDVFWRVEPGARFVVHTPQADVTVKGTCFRVKVRAGEEDMNRRDVVSGALGAVVTAAAFVGVYEGKVAVSRAGQSVDVTAGQGAQADGRGVRATGPADGAAQAFDREGTEGEKALAEANANLSDSVQAYRRRLEALADEKHALEAQLAVAEAKLADGGGAAAKSEYDLSQDDWKKLAKEGEVRMRVPCSGPKNDFSYSAESMNKLGLPPQDGPVVQAAFQRSNARAWGVVQPLCSEALGGADVKRIGLQACMSVLGEITRQKSSATYDEDVREVAEILAGERPAPRPSDPVDPLLTAYLALARESHAIESDLAQSLGPDDARRVAYAEEGCWWNSSHGVGPRSAQ